MNGIRWKIDIWDGTNNPRLVRKILMAAAAPPVWSGTGEELMLYLRDILARVQKPSP